MTLKKTELAVIGLTIAFFCFIVGYFSGQSSAKGTFRVQTQEDAPVPKESAVYSSQPDAVESAAAQDDKDAPAAETPAVTPEQTPTQSTAETAAPADKPAQTDPPAQTQAVQAGKININSADAAMLDTLPGIGPVLAQRIIDYRQQHGAYKQIADIMLVKGIGEGIYADIQALIQVK